MEHSKDLIERIFASHWGCECAIQVRDGMKQYGWQKSGITVSRYALGHTKLFKLLLTPPLSMLDEDAIEVAKMAYSINNSVQVEIKKIRREDNGTVRVWCRYPNLASNRQSYVSISDNGLPRLFEQDSFDGTNKEQKFFQSPQLCVDYLRSSIRPDGTRKPVYDCGYAHLSSLIEAGIALNATEFNNDKESSDNDASDHSKYNAE